MSNVVLSHISKIYTRGQRPAVDDFDLEVKSGEFLVLVGPSGCGKSTSLRMVAGLETPSAGTISIGGRDVTQAAPKDRDIAMVFQNYALYPHMTVRRNMEFALRLRKYPKAEIARRVKDVSSSLGLEEYLERLPKALSGGQRQRVALARAIVREPAVFLFDEPLSNLDAKMRVDMRTEIIRLHQRLKATMIYVTHDQTEAMTMADRIVVMNEGRIRQVASPMEVYLKPADEFVASFIGTPAMNIFPAGTLDGKRAIGVRPEFLVLSREKGPGAFEATVDFSEPLGAETLVHTRSFGGAVSPIVRCQGFASFTPREKLFLSFDSARAVIFSRQ